MGKEEKTAIQPTREQNYPEWYQQVIKAADLAENSAVRGCMVIKPWGYGIWENMKEALDGMFKATGHENAYFPLLIPLSYLAKEAEHVDGFAKECAVVTHHRLEGDGEGGLVPAGKLEEPFVIRPTSEMIIGASYSKWVQSYRDLPILVNQWANVMRWEMRTRMFLRTSEFLWQEGHTVHSTSEEAREETNQMLKVYAKFAEEWMAMPVVMGEKTPDERFPGAVSTYAIEAMMQDGKALQAGTSHYMGQNFAKACNIKFLNREGSEEFAWTTSWGVSTRLIGGLIMTHSDDNGLVLPPKLAPRQIVILPMLKKDSEDQVMDYCRSLKAALEAKTLDNQPLRVKIDARDIRGGEKQWQYIKQGVPIRVEVGPRDIKSDSVFVGRRDQSPRDKFSLSKDEFVEKAADILQEIQDGLFSRAKTRTEESTVRLDSLEEFEKYFREGEGGFAFVSWHEDAIDHPLLAKLKVTPRCIPLEGGEESGTCIFTGKETDTKVLFAKAY